MSINNQHGLYFVEKNINSTRTLDFLQYRTTYILNCSHRCALLSFHKNHLSQKKLTAVYPHKLFNDFDCQQLSNMSFSSVEQVRSHGQEYLVIRKISEMFVNFIQLINNKILQFIFYTVRSFSNKSRNIAMMRCEFLRKSNSRPFKSWNKYLEFHLYTSSYEFQQTQFIYYDNRAINKKIDKKYEHLINARHRIFSKLECGISVPELSKQFKILKVTIIT